MPYKSSFDKLSLEHRQRRSVLADWLEKLQQESWQLELLISGFAILGCLEASKAVEKKMVLMQANSSMDLYSTIVGMGMSLLATALTIFIINLVIHVVTRALWIGAIGLRYVSGEIDHDQLPYNDRFKDYFRDRVGDFDEYIDKIERFSSTIFSYTFLLVFILFAFFLFLATPFVLAVTALSGVSASGLAYSLGYEAGQGNYFGMVLLISALLIFVFYLFLGFVVAFDFFTLGKLKRIKKKWFVRIYMPIYRFYSFITLSFIWRPLLLNFLDERFTRRMFRFTFPYVLAITFLPEIGSEPYRFHPAFHQSELALGVNASAHYYWFAFYDDLIDDENWRKEASLIENFSIPSKRVNGPLFEVFVKYAEKDSIPKNAGIQAFNKTGMTYADGEFGAMVEVLKDTVLTKELKETLSHYKELIKTESDPQRKAELVAEQEVAIFGIQKQYRANKEQNLIAVKELLLEGFQIRIDDQPVPSSSIDADFYTHPRHGERGMLCFFALDSLAVGRHTFSLERRLENTRDLLHNTTTIPFMYEGR